MKVKKWITNNLGLKILSLVLAMATWFYVNSELTKLKNEEGRAIVSMLRYKIISKKLPIQLTIVGEIRKGYKLTIDDITVDPETIVVVGPENILREVNSARTMPLDIGEYTKDVIKQIELAPIAKGIALKDSIVKVYLPILKEEGEPAVQ